MHSLDQFSYVHHSSPPLCQNLQREWQQTRSEFPSLAMLDTKARQLEALKIVRKQAASSYKSLEEERTRMTKLLKQMSPQRGGGDRRTSYNMSTAPEPDSYLSNPVSHEERRNTNQVYFQRGPSLAESTIERYKGPEPQANDTRPHADVVTKFCHATGQQHPFDSEKIEQIPSWISWMLLMWRRRTQE